MDGVSLPQTYLTGHTKEEVLHPQIRALHQITLLETVLTILYIHTYIHTATNFKRVLSSKYVTDVNELDYTVQRGL